MLFDKNGFYLIGTSDANYDFALDIMNGKTDLKKMPVLDVYDPSEALKRGNLFPHLYKPYKSCEPASIKVSTEREKCLLEIQKLDFAINDLNLYLDLNPDDEKMYYLMCKYVEESKCKKDEYKRLYGPLMLDDLTDEYEWSKSIWPWEEGRM